MFKQFMYVWNNVSTTKKAFFILVHLNLLFAFCYCFNLSNMSDGAFYTIVSIHTALNVLGAIGFIMIIKFLNKRINGEELNDRELNLLKESKNSMELEIYNNPLSMHLFLIKEAVFSAFYLMTDSYILFAVQVLTFAIANIGLVETKKKFAECGLGFKKIKAS